MAAGGAGVGGRRLDGAPGDEERAAAAGPRRRGGSARARRWPGRRALEAQGRWLDALRRFENAGLTFDGLADVAEARREAARVASLPATKAALREERDWDRYEERTSRTLADAYRKLLASDPPLLAAAFRSEVQLDELRRHAAAPGYEGVVGRRLLDTLATETGFYITRELLARKDHARALAALAVATEAAPDRPGYWYNLACVQARLGGRRQALDALERAVAAGYSDRARHGQGRGPGVAARGGALQGPRRLAGPEAIAQRLG